MDNEVVKFIYFLKEKYALDVSAFDTSFLEKGIKARMSAVKCNKIADYVLLFEQMPDEVAELSGLLSNSYSEFFRNQLTFAYIEQIVLPMLITKKKQAAEKEIRIWSAAGASGQESYSMAILWDEINDYTKADLACRIFSTDISHEELSNAQKGIFHQAAVGKVTQKRIQAYFIQQGEYYAISPKLKNNLNFSIFDLLSDEKGCPAASIYGNFDLIFCCNLLFYYQSAYRQRIIDKVSHCLAPGGYLITGETEREIVKDNNFIEVFANSAIFQKKH